MKTVNSAFADTIAEIKASPRRYELVKPAVMFVVAFLLVIFYSIDLNHAISALKAAPLADQQLITIKVMSWTLSFYAMGMGTVMTSFLYLAGTKNNIKQGKNETIYKIAAHVIHIGLFVAALVMFFTINDHERVPVMLTVSSILLANLIIMTGVEKVLIKRSTPTTAAVPQQ